MTVAPTFSFTVSADGLLNVLKTSCHISQAFNHANGDPAPPRSDFVAIWDTGATASVITQEVVDACGLKPIGMTQVHGVGGLVNCEVYLVSVTLPNNLTVPEVRVTKGNLGPDTGVLIGMDIISLGDFSITNKDAKTIFSFRVPSMHHVDFVKEHTEQVLHPKMQHGGTKTKRKKQPKTFGKNKHK